MSTPTVTPFAATTFTPAPNQMSILTESLTQNKIVVAAMIVSLAVLVAAIVGFGKKKEQ
jgi:hypothetical protein